MMVDAEDLVIRKTLHVDAPLEQAFDTFTRGWHAWWPMATHSIGNGQGQIDWRVGGLATELVDGTVHEWGDIVEYDPPHGFLMRWRVTPAHPPTELRLRFAADGDGTRVELTHAGWEAYPDGGAVSFAGYTSGWDVVLAHYVSHVND